jgi:myxalamid-type nonribosomal peptide synthetase MxaA
VSQGSDRLAGLSSEQRRALLARLLQQAPERGSNLSPAQQRQWFIGRLNPETPAIVKGFEVSGRLDVAALEQGLVDLVQRHQTLRTSFVEVAGRAFRKVAESVEVPLQLVELDAGSRDRLDRLLGQAARSPIDPGHAPLFRVTVARLATGQDLLVVALHPMVGDAASIDVFVRELAELYDAGLSGRDPDLPGLAAQYDDVVAEQRRDLRGHQARAELALWRTRLAGAPVLELPADRPRPPVQTFAGRRVERRLPAAGLERLSAAAGVRHGSVLLAAFAVLAARHAGQDEVVVGVPAPARSGPRRERAIGPLANTLVLRLDLGGDPTFRELAGRVEAAWREAEAHQTVPFGQLVTELQPSRDLSRGPFFQAMFEPRDDPRLELEAGGLHISESPADPGTARCDVALVAARRESELETWLEYNSDLFEAATAARLLDRFALLLEGGLAAPATAISDLPMTPPPELATLLAWAAGDPLALPDRRFDELVEAQARRTPDALAVVFEGEHLTYRDLDEQANRVAHRLRRLRARRGSLVAIALERSPDLVVGLLGILRAGAAYVPVDPGYPPDRVRFMIEDSGAGIVLTQQPLLARLPLDGRALLCLDRDRALVAKEPSRAPESGAGPRDLAYVMYTSGSTGVPKGVMVEHRCVVNLAEAQRRALGLGPGSRVLQFSSTSFDASVWEMAMTLAAGATLVLVPEDTLRDPRRLAETLREREVDMVTMPPSLLQHVSVREVPHSTTIVNAGEAVWPELARRWSRGRTYLNAYGPTEITCACLLGSLAVEAPGTVGRPIANTGAYLLDARLRPVPFGVTGEVYIGGAGVARGYMSRPGLTAQRFLPDPFSIVPGARMYRTGDLARHLADGQVEYVGRADEQVKVRGVRIELGEIEAVLAQHPAVREAVVAAREEGPGERRLVGYVVPAGGEAPARSDLIAFLRRRLPDAMLPSAFVTLEGLPLTPNGKVDRRALPDAGAERQELAREYVPPGSPLEAVAAETIAEVLGVERVGAHDPFFDLGMNSLHVSQVAARLRSRLEIDVPVRYFFQRPTVAELAQLIEVYQQEGLRAAVGRTAEAELKADARLDPAIDPQGLPPATRAGDGAALLTGATGYLGAFLLDELLRQTGKDVYCLVRAAGPREGMDRIRSAAAGFRIPWGPEYERRVHAVAGDLSRPRFGLTEGGFDDLASRVDTIYHSAAKVNFVYPYPSLKPINVTGTQEVLRLACTASVKPVHYVSTADVFIGSGVQRPWRERELPDDPGQPPDGYIRSKWVAEKLMEGARARGVPVSIYRPVLTMGNTQTGACHTTDYFCVALRGYLQLGMAPDLNEVVNVIPVDFLSRALVHISLQERAAGGIFHFAHPDPPHLQELYEWVRQFGYRLELAPYHEVRAAVLRVDQSHPIYPIVPLHPPEERLHTELFEPTAFEQVDSSRTAEILAGSGISCPPASGEAAARVLRYLVDAHFLEPPERQRTDRELAGAVAGRDR